MAITPFKTHRADFKFKEDRGKIEEDRGKIEERSRKIEELPFSLLITRGFWAVFVTPEFFFFDFWADGLCGCIGIIAFLGPGSPVGAEPPHTTPLKFTMTEQTLEALQVG